MKPIITKISQEDLFLKFTVENINVSLANAIRRTVLSDIPIIVFRTMPHKDNRANIKVNTTRMNNEIIKQRLSCIPIHIDDLKFPIDDYIINIKKINDTDTIQFVTTEDFEIVNKNTGEPIPKNQRDKIFPANSITGDYIDLLRLRPSTNEEISGEQIDITCTLDVGTAKQDGAYNVVSTCSYGCTQDLIKVNDEWTKKLVEFKEQGLSKDEISEEEANWHTLEAKRIIKKDSFDFTIESIGIFSNINIIYQACHILSNKLKKIITLLESDDELIKPSKNNLANGFDITLPNEDYTIGKVIEYLFFELHYGKILSFCAFNKAHPHDSFSTICLGFNKPTDSSEVLTYVNNVCNTASQIFETLSENFTEDK